MESYLEDKQMEVDSARRPFPLPQTQVTVLEESLAEEEIQIFPFYTREQWSKMQDAPIQSREEPCNHLSETPVLPLHIFDLPVQGQGKRIQHSSVLDFASPLGFAPELIKRRITDVGSIQASCQPDHSLCAEVSTTPSI